MALVNYSSSSESDEPLEDFEESKCEILKLKADKNKRKLPVPDFITKSRKVNSVVDYPDEHEGRIRSFEHVRGNWASFVYIAVNADYEDLQNNIQGLFKNIVHLKLFRDFHISLTKTLILHHHWISSFVESMIEFFKNQSIFRLCFRSLDTYTNDEKTRTFIGLTVDLASSVKIKELTNGVDKILEEYRLKKFYTEPLFHASILWCIGNHKKYLQTKSKELQQIFNNFFENQPNDFVLKIKKIHIKIGNKYYNCDLKS